MLFLDLQQPDRPGTVGGPPRSAALLAALTGALLCAALPVNASAATYYVDASNPACSNYGPGTQSIPFCSISAALGAHHDPGTTILVRPGVYREQVTVPASGEPGNPIVLQAIDGTVVVDGADDFSDPALWSQQGSTAVWLASGVSWSPRQVFAGDARLDGSAAAPEDLLPSSFRWITGIGLYVNVGGENPASHQVMVGHRSHGFRLPGRSWVVVDGFDVTRSERNAIYLLGGAEYSTIKNNRVSLAAVHGIGVDSCANVSVVSNVAFDNGDHGIAFIDRVTGSRIEGNESFRNSSAAQSGANGVSLFRSTSNTILNNRLHDNQHTGVEVDSASHDAVLIQNRSWNNGAHGFNQLYSSRVTHVGDVAWGNAQDGFSVEGGSINAQFYNCIAGNNGLGTNHTNLFVEVTSTPGFVSDYNIFWMPTPQALIRFGTDRYYTVASFTAATGQDAHSFETHPMFVSPTLGDFRLLPSSPAIDCALTSMAAWPATDANGNPRWDYPEAPNTGAGPVAYADRGALEFDGSVPGGVDGALVPAAVECSPAFPNPSGGGVAFTFQLPSRAYVHWAIVDVQGRMMWSDSRDYSAGQWGIHWDGRGRDGSDRRPGLYFARMQIGPVSLSRRFVLLH